MLFPFVNTIKMLNFFCRDFLGSLSFTADNAQLLPFPHFFPMIRLSTIFSLNNLPYIAAVLVLLWLLRDYPQWRSKRISTAAVKSGSSTSSHPAEQTRKTRISDGYFKTDVKKHHDDSSDRANNQLGVLHYILMFPFATVYVLFRGAIDFTRFLLYNLLWFLEKSAPTFDAWLFEKVTVWLPAKVDQAEKWWDTRGIHIWQTSKKYVTDTILPAIILGVENIFFILKRIWELSHRSGVALRKIWINIAQRHDWRQVAQDAIEFWTIYVWPSMSYVAAKLYSIAILVYTGSIRTVKSVGQDIVWIFTTALPALYDYVASTRIFRALHQAYRTCTDYLFKMSALFTPLVRIIQETTVAAIDALVRTMQSERFQRLWRAFERNLRVQASWFLAEALVFTISLGELTRYTVDHLLIPFVIFTRRELYPHLQATYRRILETLQPLYMRFLAPLWSRVYPLLIPLYQRISEFVSAPMKALWILSCDFAAKLWSVTTAYIAISVAATKNAMIHITTLISPYVKQAYSSVLGVIESYAPKLYIALRRAFEKTAEVLSSFVYNDLVIFTGALREWLAIQSELLFASLERLLAAWFQEQSSDEQQNPKKHTAICTT